MQAKLGGMHINSPKCEHEFTLYTKTALFFQLLLSMDPKGWAFNCLVEVYMDDYILMMAAMSEDQIQHIVVGVMWGILDIFPPTMVNKDKSILVLLGINFSGTIWLDFK